MKILGIDLIWWLVTALIIIAVPAKIKFVKWWSSREMDKKKGQKGKWGEDQ